MSDDGPTFWIGRNPGSRRLPYLLRLPVRGEGRIFLAARETWPRGTDVFCHQVAEWPAETEMLEEVPVEACWRVGAAVHLVLRRPRNRRSLFVWTKKGERTLIFWRSEASMRRARPGIRVPLARDFGERLSVAIDVGERYPWRFSGAETERRRLPVGDYALVRDDRVVAAVERKTPQDLATAAVGGQLGLALAELAQIRHGAIVIEGRLSDVLKVAERVRPGWLLNVIAALQVEHPGVSWMFAETRQLAQDWAYRWLAAASRIESPRAIPLLDERALGEPDFTYDGRPQLQDASARRMLIAEEARAGKEWTSRAAAQRCNVTQATAAADLRALVHDGTLRVTGSGVKRRYLAM